MKKVAMSFLGFAFAILATHASAAVIEDFGFIPESDTDPFETVVFPHVVDVGDFDDTWLFTLAQESSVSVSVDNLPNENSGFTFLDIENLSTTLLDSSGSVATFSGNGQTGTLLLGPGAYTVQITGAGTGVAGGAYLGAITVVQDVSAIPIPAAGLLFFSGIAALGFVRSKRASA